MMATSISNITTRALVATGLAASAMLALVLLLARPDAAAARAALPLAVLALIASSVYGAAGSARVLRIANAMLRRTTLTYLSYRAQLVSLLIYVSITVLLFFVAGGPFLRVVFAPLTNLQDQGVSQHLVLFLVIGFATWPIFWRSWEITTMGVRTEQWEGTFESVLPMPHGVRALPFGYLYSRIGFTLIYNFAVLGALTFALPGTGLHLYTLGSVLEFATVLIVTIVTMWGMGLLFGGLAILYKQVGPADLIVRSLFLFLAGVFVPLEILPGWAQTLARFLPLTYAFELLRSIAVDGVPLAERGMSLMILVGFAITFVVAGNLLYKFYVNKARTHGAIQGY